MTNADESVPTVSTFRHLPHYAFWAPTVIVVGYVAKSSMCLVFPPGARDSVVELAALQGLNTNSHGPLHFSAANE